MIDKRSREEYIKEYENADKYLVLNKYDRSLLPFRIFLPKPPMKHLIYGYGKKKENQVFVKPQYPYKLKLLEQKIRQELLDVKKREPFNTRKLIVRMWEELNANRGEYIKEIEFIKRQHFHIRNGYWFYNYGKPTYITGSHYAFLTEWSIDDVTEVEYRNRDREIYLLLEHINTTTLGYKERDMMTRTLYGIIYPKHRRDGATHKFLCELYFGTIYHAGESIGAIQAEDGDGSRDQYIKLLASFKSMKFYLRPLWSGTSDSPQGELRFEAPSYLGYLKSLGNRIEYADTSNRKAFDGRKVNRFLVDEGGKTIGEKVDERWTVQKRTLSTGGSINGLAMFPSTTADMEAENGKLFENIAKDSMHEERNKTTGSTKSGLVVYFKAACYGLEKFIDKFGYAVVDDPKEEDLWRLKDIRRDSEGKLVGARRFLLDMRNTYLEEGTDEDMANYLQELKLTPLEYLESFAGGVGGVGMDVIAIKKRISELKLMDRDGETPTVRGDYVWKIGENVVTSKEFIDLGYHLSPRITNNAVVLWQPNPNGKFEVSQVNKNPNRRIYQNDMWYPDGGNTHIASADTITWLKKKNTKDKKSGFSLASGAVFKRRSQEDKNKNVSEYTSFNFEVTYLYRTNLEEYLEDMLMMCVFNNVLMFPESNIQNVEQYFVDRGFGGYLLYRRKANGRLSDRAGFYSKEISQDTLVQQLRSYSNRFVYKENHLIILTQLMQFQGVESLTRLDILVAAGGCLLGDMELSKYDIYEEMNDYSDERRAMKKEKFFDEFYY